MSYRAQIFVVLVLAVLFVTAGVFAINAPRSGVTLSLSPANSEIKEGNTLNTSVLLDTGGNDVIAVEVVIKFDDNDFGMECSVGDCIPVSVNTDLFPQIAKIWKVGNNELHIVVGAVVPVKTAKGDMVRVADVQFEALSKIPSAKRQSQVDILSTSAVILNDGFGTNILKDTAGGSYIILPSGSTGGGFKEITVSNVAAVVDTPKRTPTSCSTSATIFWETNIPSDSKVYYKEGDPSLSSPLDKYVLDKIISHEVELPNLKCDTTYYYRVESELDVDSKGTSNILNFYTGTIGTVDEALAISNVGVTVHARSAVITWSTNKLADTNIKTISPTTPTNPTFTNSSIKTLFHSTKLTTLTPNTKYTAVISSTNDDGTKTKKVVFTTEDEDLSVNANYIVKAKRDRVCSAWLECSSSVTIENDKGNKEDVCFDFALCDKLDTATGKCANIKRQADPLFKVVVGDSSQSTIRDARYLTGAVKAGAEWYGTCSNNGSICVSDENCGTGNTCESGTTKLGNVEGFYSYSRMDQVGSSLSVPNGSFEGGSQYPWEPRFKNSDSSTDTFDDVRVIADRTDVQKDLNNVLSVTPIKNNHIYSGVKVGVGKTNREGAQYYVSFDARTDDPNIKELIVQFGFNNYETFSDEATDKVPISSGWQRIIAGPLEVKSEDIPTSGKETMLGFLFDRYGTRGPYQPFYIDNVAIHPVLKASPNTNIVRTCRAYPSDEALSCKYLDLVSGREFQGWEGYCIDTDPRNPNRCIQWLPVDLIAGSQSTVTREALSSYSDQKPLYYCSESAGNYPYEREVVAGGQDVGYRLIVRNGGWNYESGLLVFDELKDGTTNQTVSFGKDDIDHIVLRVGNTENPDWPQSQDFVLNVAGGEKELVWCGNDKGRGSCPTQAALLNKDKREYWEKVVSKRSECAWFGKTRTSPIDNDDNIFGVRAVFDESTGLFKAIEAGLCDGSNNNGWLDMQVIVYLREVCTEIVQAVTPFGDNALYADRIKEDSGYVIKGLGYTYNQDYNPFGAIVPPQPDYNPEQWDSSESALGIQPLYVGPPDKKNFPNEPYQVRAGASYSVARVGGVGVAQCISGSQPGMACVTNDDCGIDTVNGVTGVCVGINAPSSVKTEDFYKTINRVDDYALSQIVARTEGVWRWDTKLERYRQVCDGSGTCSDYLCGYNTDESAPKAGAVCDPNKSDPKIDCPDFTDSDGTIVSGTCSNQFCFLNGVRTSRSCTDATVLTDCTLPYIFKGATDCRSLDYGWDNTSNLVNSSDTSTKYCVAGQVGKECAQDTECDLFDSTGFCVQYGNYGSACAGGPKDGEGCFTDLDCRELATKGVCSTNAIGDATPPSVKNIILTSPYMESRNTPDTLVVSDGQSISLSFTSHVAQEQVPLVRYTVDWGDGRVSEESYLEIAPKTDEGKPHLLTHTYFCEDGSPGWDATNKVCKFKPTIQIEDNWGWCSGGQKIDVVASASSILPVFVPIEVSSTAIDNHSGDSSCKSLDVYAGTIQVVPANRELPPVAKFTATPISGEVPLLVNFDGSVSADPNGRTLTFAWDFDNDGTVDSTIEKPTYTYNVDGSYTAKLTVTNADGISNSTTQIITVNPPTLTLTASHVTASVGEIIRVPISVSGVSSATPIDYTSMKLSFDRSILEIGEATASPSNTTFGWQHSTNKGTGVITATGGTAVGGTPLPVINDGVLFEVPFTALTDGFSDIAITQAVLSDRIGTVYNTVATDGSVTVSPNKAPTINNAKLTQGVNTVSWIMKGESVDLEITAMDPEGQLLNVVVEWGDGTTTSGSMPSGTTRTFRKNYSKSGVYDINYTVTDPELASDSGNITGLNVINWYGGGRNSPYEYRKQITVVNSDPSVLNSGFPVQAKIDTASLVGLGKMQTSGDDLRIVWQDSNDNLRELDRHIINMNQSSSYIWFQTQTSIAGGDSDGTYWVYYGDPSASNPPNNVNNIFIPGNDANTVALYHFEKDAGTSTVLRDTSGTNNGVLTNGPTWQAGRFGQSIDFDGSNDFVKIAHSSQLELAEGTIEMWATASDVSPNTQGQTYFSKDRLGGGTGGHIFGMISDNSVAVPERPILMRIQDAVGGNSSTQIKSDKDDNFNVWHHVAFTWGPSGPRIYINGVLQSDTDPSWTTGIDTNTVDLYLGVNTWGDPGDESNLNAYLDGRLDGLRISNIQRTSFPYAERLKSQDPITQVSIPEASLSNPFLALLNSRVAGASTYVGDGTEIKKEIAIDITDIWDSMKFTGRLVRGIFIK